MRYLLFCILIVGLFSFETKTVFACSHGEWIPHQTSVSSEPPLYNKARCLEIVYVEGLSRQSDRTYEIVFTNVCPEPIDIVPRICEVNCRKKTVRTSWEVAFDYPDVEGLRYGQSKYVTYDWSNGIDGGSFTLTSSLVEGPKGDPCAGTCSVVALNASVDSRIVYILIGFIGLVLLRRLLRTNES